MNKGVIITTKIIIIAAILIAAVYFISQQDQLQLTGGAPKATTIKSTQEASNKIIDISANIDDLGSLLEDLDQSLR